MCFIAAFTVVNVTIVLASIFQLPRGLRGRVLPVPEPVHVGRPEVPERRDVPRADERDARPDLPVLVPRRLHGQLLRDRRLGQRLQRQPVPERRDMHPTEPHQLYVRLPARDERYLLLLTT